MGNTLCKPVINPPIQNVEQPKDIEPLLTEEVIKILVINEPEKIISEATVSEATVIKEEVVSEATVSEATVSEATISEATISEATVTEPPVIKEDVVSEATISEATVSEATVITEPIISEATANEEVKEPIVEPIIEEESRVYTLVEEKLSLITPPDDLKEDELVTPMKKKRGRKKKGEQ